MSPIETRLDGDAVHVERSRQQVRSDRIVVVRVRRHDAPPLPRPRHQAVLSHQPGQVASSTSVLQ